MRLSASAPIGNSRPAPDARTSCLGGRCCVSHWSQFVSDDLVLRLYGPPTILRCVCCGIRYERGQFRCCAPATHMASHNWLAMNCPTCHKCARHCACPDKQDRLGKGPLASMAAEFVKDPPGFIDRALNSRVIPFPPRG